MESLAAERTGPLSAKSAILQSRNHAITQLRARRSTMPILSDKDRALLKSKFGAELQDEVKITYFTQHESGLSVPGLECPGCKETHELLEELVSIWPKLSLQTLDFLAQEERAAALWVDKIPATVLETRDG